MSSRISGAATARHPSMVVRGQGRCTCNPLRPWEDCGWCTNRIEAEIEARADAERYS